MQIGISKTFRLTAAAVGLTVTMFAIGGCGPEVSESELGKVETKVPERFADAAKPYEMPELGPPLEEEEGPRGNLPH